MANDDPFDYAFGQFGDVNPPGTMTALGLGPNDPLYDWGSNMRPADLAQYVHNPEAFKQAMINSGQAPPNHNYVQGANGQLQPVDQHNLPLVQTTPGGKIQGNLSDYLNPPAGQTAAQAVAPPAAPGGPSRALGYTDITTGAEIPGTPANPPPSEIGKKIKELFTVPPDAPIRQPGQIMAPAAPKPPPGSASAAPIGPPAPAPAASGTPFEPAPPIPVPQPRPVAATPSTPEKEKEKKVEALSSEAMSDFAKSLQGVKMPQRPAWQPMGAPSVRSPVAVHPEIQTLLAAIGQGRPALQQMALMRLLGRA